MATKRIAIFIALLLVLTPLSGEVFAQSAQATSTDATSTQAEVVQEEGNWYRSEQLSGNVSVGDFVVGPGRAEITVSPGETIVQEISVTNRISPHRKFHLEVEDIYGTNDASAAAKLSGSEKGPYSIRDYISFPSDTFELDLGERARIPVTITVPADAEPGGFYGSILVSTERTAESGEDTGSRSPIIARIGSLVFLTVRGDVEVGGQTKSISTVGNKWWYEKGPIDFSILYENTGAIHVNPYGEISITNMLGEEVGFVELDPWFVLPKSLRSREITWDREFLLGRYKVTAKINRGYDDKIDEVTTTFWVLPWKIVGGSFLIFFIVIFGIRTFLRTFEFKRK
jgi:hypothetical protein